MIRYMEDNGFIVVFTSGVYNLTRIHGKYFHLDNYQEYREATKKTNQLKHDVWVIVISGIITLIITVVADRIELKEQRQVGLKQELRLKALGDSISNLIRGQPDSASKDVKALTP